MKCFYLLTTDERTVHRACYRGWVEWRVWEVNYIQCHQYTYSYVILLPRIMFLIKAAKYLKENYSYGLYLGKKNNQRKRKQASLLNFHNSSPVYTQPLFNRKWLNFENK